MKKSSLIFLFLILIFVFDLTLFLGLNKITKVNNSQIDSFNKNLIINMTEMTEEKILYQEEILNGAIPQLTKHMIPIYYENNEWKKADLETKWYSYEQLNWANVAIPKKEFQDYYDNAKEGTNIRDDDILGYFVWIPRFEYQLFNVNFEKVEEQMINVNFVSSSSVKKNTLENGLYYTHPAFTAFYNNTTYELNGFWIAKFEPSLNTNDLVEIKANKHTLVNLNMADMVNYAQNLNINYDIDISSRIITNMEWGAIAYLSYSQYGKINNNDYYGNNKNIFLNTAMGSESTWDNVQTGCSSGRISGGSSYDCPYDYSEPYYGTGASSTGTINGIYDLAGGSWECVMGIISNYPIRKNIGGYNGDVSTEKRYYTLYQPSTNMYDYSRGLIGDATRETLSNKLVNKSWNGNLAYFSTNSHPWIKRGGTFRGGSFSGLFDYGITDALPRGDKTFRIILSAY